MVMSNLNKTMCEKLFGGDLDVMEKTPDPFKSNKSQIRQYRNWLHERNERQLEILQKVETALEKMDSFSRTKKNMHLPITEGIRRRGRCSGRYGTILRIPSATLTPSSI